VNELASRYVVEKLADNHERAGFDCGVESLTRYLRQQASQDARRRVSTVYVLRPREGFAVAGFYTLANTALQLSDLPPELARKLPRYPHVPATLLGRLAVDLRHRGVGVGEFLLFDAMRRAVTSSRETASFALVVDAKDAAAKTFYERYGFESMAHAPKRLYATIADIEHDFQP